ncbi:MULTISPECIES: hypothetical protein [unclassified Bacillus (in: firmicutes)]|nr:MULTISPECIES: hypothetical protein [unclassified Bacillus (in: firmicutes)]OCA86858.1 hypothetical protein A8L44_06165 [Bacillus sp. FJAT-27986]
MTNIHFATIEQYNGVGMKNLHNIEIWQGRFIRGDHADHWKNGRDNSRTLVQWDDTHQAGITTNKSA